MTECASNFQAPVGWSRARAGPTPPLDRRLREWRIAPPRSATRYFDSTFATISPMLDHVAMLSIVTCGPLAGGSAGTSTPAQAPTEARPASGELATADPGARIYNVN